MRLSEAVAIYVPVDPGAKARPRQNSRIKTFLRAALRKRAEEELSLDWQQIEGDYSVDFQFFGSPEEGTAELRLNDGNSCYGFGRKRLQPLHILLPQRELFDKEGS